MIVILLLITGVTISGCGYGRECNGSPLQEYNKYKEWVRKEIEEKYLKNK